MTQSIITYKDPFGGAAGAAVGAGMGLLLGGIERKKQREQQQAMQNMQIQGQQEMSRFNYGQQMKLWNDTGYGAQMKQLKEAGLNPGLLYGQGGGGGQTAAAEAGNVTGGQATQGNSGAMGIQMGLATAMQTAQMELIKAQTEKTKVEANKIGGVDTELGQTQILDLTQGIKNKIAQQKLTEVQTEIGTLTAKLQGGTLETNIATANKELERLTAQTRSSLAQAGIDEQTQDEKIRLIEIDVVKQLATIELINAQKNSQEQGIKKSEAEIQKMAADVAQGWAMIKQRQEGTDIEWGELGQRMRQADAAQKNATTQRMLADFETSFGGQAAGVLGTIVNSIPLRGGRKPIGGFKTKKY